MAVSPPLLSAATGGGRSPGYRWMAVTSVGVLVWLGPWLLEPRGALGAGLGDDWAASLRLSLSAASICSWQARRQSWEQGGAVRRGSWVRWKEVPLEPKVHFPPPIAGAGDRHRPAHREVWGG